MLHLQMPPLLRENVSWSPSAINLLKKESQSFLLAFSRRDGVRILAGFHCFQLQNPVPLLSVWYTARWIHHHHMYFGFAFTDSLSLYRNFFDLPLRHRFRAVHLIQSTSNPPSNQKPTFRLRRRTSILEGSLNYTTIHACACLELHDKTQQFESVLGLRCAKRTSPYAEAHHTIAIQRIHTI